MSTWISKAGLALALVALAACRGDPVTMMAAAPGDAGMLANRTDGPPPRLMAVAGQRLVIAGPKGFCIDRDASRDPQGKSALVVLSDCRGLGAGLFAPRPAFPALLTAAVAQAAAARKPTQEALAAFLVTAQGRAVLSRVGRADTVTVHEALPEDGVLFLHLSDSAPFSWGPVAPPYWRAMLELDGRMVTMSVLAFPGTPPDRDEALTLLREFVSATQDATVRLGKPAI